MEIKRQHPPKRPARRPHSSPQKRGAGDIKQASAEVKVDTSSPKPKKRFHNRFRNKTAARQKRLDTLAALVPNMTTTIGMCSGLTGIWFALHGQWSMAVIAVLLAAFFDALDGRLARMLDSSSQFGAELDSFSDLVTFGFTPAFIMYTKTLHALNEMGWLCVLLSTVCMALRLARFNVGNLNPTKAENDGAYFTGVPAPAAGFLVLSPLIFEKAFPAEPLFQSPWFCVSILVFASIMMVSRLKTYSLKKVSVSPKMVKPILICVVLLVTVIYMRPWHLLSFMAFVYIGSVPISAFSAARKKKS